MHPDLLLSSFAHVALLWRCTGKLADNEVVMAHPSVSRSHALLVVDRTLGAFLVDMGASNGSFLDGRVSVPFIFE